MLPWSFFLTLLAVAFGAGALGALLGLGGGVVLVPALTLLGVDIRLAIGASIVSVIATSCAAAATYVRERIANLRVAMFLETGTVTGGVAGSLLAGVVSRQALYLVLAAVLAYSAWLMLRRRQRARPPSAQGDALARRLRLGASYYDPALAQTVECLPARTLPVLGASCLAGVASGLLGIGGGPLQVPAMDVMMRLPIKMTSATSNLMIGVTAAASAGIYFLRGQISPLIAAPVALGALGGTLVGTYLLTRLRGQVIRLVFVTLLAALAVQMLLKGLL